MSSILAIFKFISELWSVLSGVLKAWSQAKKEGWIQDGQKITQAIKEAKTDEERRDLVRRLASSINSTP